MKKIAITASMSKALTTESFGETLGRIDPGTPKDSGITIEVAKKLNLPLSIFTLIENPTYYKNNFFYYGYPKRVSSYYC